MNNRAFAAVMLFIACCFVAFAALAGPVVRDVCGKREPTRWAQQGDVLRVYCPGRALPRLTVRGCPTARVLRDGAGNYKVICGG